MNIFIISNMVAASVVEPALFPADEPTGSMLILVTFLFNSLQTVPTVESMFGEH